MSIVEIYNKIKDIVRSKWDRAFKREAQIEVAIPVVEVQAPVPEPVPEPAPEPAPKVQKIHEPDSYDEDSNYGVFTHFDDLLDKMDSYFMYLEMLKKDDRNAFDLYSKIGGQIIGSKAFFQAGSINSDWMASRPSFGMAHWINADVERGIPGLEKRTITPKLLYFQKVKQASYIQKTDNDIYNLVMYYVDSHKPRLRKPFSWHVELLPDGTCRALKELSIGYMKVGKKNPDFVPRKQWLLPEALMSLFMEHRREISDVHQLSSNIFAMLANSCWYASYGVRINATHKRMTGVFNVAMDRTAYFFKDRERVVNENGKTCRVFHVTRPHKRVLSNGKEIHIKMHFKGLRKFEWMGYQINITVPGLHHADLNSFAAPVEMVDETINDVGDKMDMSQLGDVLAKEIAGPEVYRKSRKVTGSRSPSP